MLTIAPDCGLDVQRGPDWLLVRVRNPELEDFDVSDLADRLWRLLQQHFTYRLVLDMNESPALSRELIEQLGRLYQRIAEHDGVMRLCGLSPKSRRIWHACHLDAQLPPYEDREAAVMGHSRPMQPR
ncbi:MAG: STAS domain-containing protein [Thermoguttaceae bacterium]